MKHYFLNLTNGIEYLPNIEDGTIHFMRIKSTTIESKDWLFLLMDLDHNFLFHLALGKEVIFVDYSTNRLLSKTIYRSLPLIEYCLNRFWLGLETKAYRRGKNKESKIFDQDEYYRQIYNSVFILHYTPQGEKLKNKLKYYKRFLNTTEIKINYVTNSTKNDGNYEFYKEFIETYYCL